MFINKEPQFDAIVQMQLQISICLSSQPQIYNHPHSFVWEEPNHHSYMIEATTYLHV